MTGVAWPPDGPDALVVAARGTAAAWCFVTDVDSSLGDIAAAEAAQDWGTCVEAGAAALRSLLHCQLILAGLEHPLYDGELDLHAALSGDDLAVLLRGLPPGYAFSEHDARAVATAVRGAAGRMRRRLPVAVPMVRTADGSVADGDVIGELLRFRADLERLRAAWGLFPLTGRASQADP